MNMFSVSIALFRLVQSLPPWSWDTIQTFSHCSNTTGPLSSAALEYFSSNSFVVIEKVQCLACEPVNHSAEIKMYAASRQLKAVNPQMETYVYHAVDVARSMYDALAWFNTHPRSELHKANGDLVVHDTSYCPGCHVFDFTDTVGPTPARWNAVVIDAIQKGGMNGAFIDGISSGGGFKASLLRGVNASKQDAWLVALNSTLAKLRQSLGNETVLIQNSHTGWPQSRDARVQLGVDGNIDSKLSFRPAPSIVSDMQLFADTSPRIAALYQNFGRSHDGGKASYNISLAAFLISMNKYAYWSFTETLPFDGDTWECSNWAHATGHEQDYRRPLGEPVEPAMQHIDMHTTHAPAMHKHKLTSSSGASRKTADAAHSLAKGSLAFSRLFASGTCVYLNTDMRAASCVWWSDGSVVGDAATCSNTTIHKAACQKPFPPLPPTPVPAPTPTPPMPVPGQGKWVELGSGSLWSDADCPAILPVLRNVTLAACQAACVTGLSRGDGCTAINANANAHRSAVDVAVSTEREAEAAPAPPDSCVLRRCKPGQKPTGGSKAGYAPWQYAQAPQY